MANGSLFHSFPRQNSRHNFRQPRHVVAAEAAQEEETWVAAVVAMQADLARSQI
jgi:hypothetical protein